MKFVDRYSATGTPYPDEGSCEECDGMGCAPIRPNGPGWADAKWREAYESSRKESDEMGYKFLTCVYCHGTRRKPS